ncbi:uncharacterized protein LOC108737009 isoform X2 [Agrilus planipennis]|uniref:Uncharacterized protein LOC108737009 isoform X1 n=1 Tax=Agrilus planipennis TaxID=224129 RepID=A0A7F5R6S8_AGRPL|nr:uncharacterized protein LOC108737009 isoform X1 [Agrilus planipennis]XP_025831673.1 uncharacterized protein LOC108737009 isoform X2 [Agrilus planipennis]
MDTWDDFQRIQKEIELAEIESIGESSSKEEHERADFETLWYQCVEAANELIKRYQKPSSNSTAGQLADNSLSPSTVQDVHVSCRLPKIELPTFDGSYDKWLNFRDSFISMIDSNPALPVIHKLHYLRSCVRAEAADLIHSLELSEDNYQVAWSLLQERYSNERVIILEHVNEVFTAPTIKRPDDSQLEWLSGGPAFTDSCIIQQSGCHLNVDNPNEEISKFWEIEEEPAIIFNSPNEKACVAHFHEHVQRDDAGKYIMKLPFKEYVKDLGKSNKTTLRRLYSLEKRLQSN